MPKGSTNASDLLKLQFNATPIANIADNAATAPLTNLYFALHTADPGAGGNQATNEATYTSYARVAVARTTGGFTVTANSVSPAALVGFPACTGAGQTYTHWSLGTAATGAGKILYSGAIGSLQGEFTALATTDTLTVPGVTGVAVGDQVSFYALQGYSLPTGITSGTLYFVKTITGDQITLSTTSGGATLDITADGGGMMYRHTPLVVTASPQVTPQLTTALAITEQ